ncbi:MAG: aminotransferase class I/II-fold pyridoxal phosphate-dependent enzyme [Gammaproteobacteria bacterium]|nr:MAG: aminotransferase class I/II-fold pyridoxal phosphate-dependent enzyme [Gammaproteobacteria bacterium]
MAAQRPSRDALIALEQQLSAEYSEWQSRKLNLDMTRGKPNAQQLALSDALDGILGGHFKAADGSDLRNYGGLEGLPEARALFAPMLQVNPDEVLIGGNSSLTLMYTSALFAWLHGPCGKDSAWRLEKEVKFLCPVPGYDRHFAICEDLGIGMIPVAMNDDGPDMDAIERLLKTDSSIKGIWCVPRFSNPSGVVYSDAVVDRIAQLGKIAAKNFRIFWDNAYSVHALHDQAPALASLMDACRRHGTEDSVYIFGSTSKITFAGAGLAFMGASKANLAVLCKHLGKTTIGPDKVNQARHVAFLKDTHGIAAHMLKHAALLAPRFDAVLQALDSAFADRSMGHWTVPQGGYFVSFDTVPGCASAVVKLAAEAGVKLTPAGATWPYGKDPEDRNIRLAPSFPSVDDIRTAMAVFTCCVKLATVRRWLQG